MVADDAAQSITDVVRGRDLLESSLAHCHLQDLLGLTRPRYGHIPVLVNTQGQKLSKQTGAQALRLTDPSAVVAQALTYLGCPPPAAVAEQTPAALWRWAIDTLRLNGLAGQAEMPVR